MFEPEIPDHSDLELDIAFARRFKEAEFHMATWWAHGTGPHAARLDKVPALRAALRTELSFSTPRVQTIRVYRGPEGWDEDRAAWQGAQLHGKHVHDSRSGGLAFVIVGLPASGKSSILRRVVQAFARSSGMVLPQRACDPDEMRVHFPEYASGLGSIIVQEELQRMVYDDPDDPLGPTGPCLLDATVCATPDAVASIFDTVGHPVHTPDVVRRLVNLDRSVHVLLADCPLETAIRRAKARALHGGRIVDPDYIRFVNGRPMRAFEACIAEPVSGYAVLDTSNEVTRRPQIVCGDAGSTFGTPGGPVDFW